MSWRRWHLEETEMRCFLCLLAFLSVISEDVVSREINSKDLQETLVGKLTVPLNTGNCLAQMGQSVVDDKVFNATLCIHTPGVTDTKEYWENYSPNPFFSTNKAEDLLDQFDEAELKARYKGEAYNVEKSVGLFRINFRGLGILASFPYGEEEEDKRTRLLFWVPELGIAEEFEGATREESLEELRNYLKRGDKASEILTKLSEISPIAPDVDLIKEMATSAFDVQSLTVATKKLNITYENRTIDMKNRADPLRDFFNQMGVTGKGVSEEGEIDLQYLSVPLSKSIKLDEGQELIPRLVFGYTNIGGAGDYRLMGGTGYRRLVNEQHKWFLTPSIDFGLEGSKDLASVTQILSVSLTSEALLWGNPESDSWTVSMGNMLGYYKSLSLFEYQGYDLEIERNNAILRNGLLFSKPLGIRLLNRELAADIHLIDMRRVSGTPMYEDQYNKIGFSIGFRKQSKVSAFFEGEENQLANVPQSMMRFSVEYFHSDVSDGWSLSGSYTW